MYEIPKIEVPVELLLMSGESIAGKMFVTEDLMSAAGNPQLEEFLNDDPDTFFPFVSKAGAYRLVNRSHVVTIKCEQDDGEIRSQTPLEPRTLVVHFTNGRTVYGEIYPTMAEETRASDLINQPETFMVIYQDGTKLIVNRAHVVYVNAN